MRKFTALALVALAAGCPQTSETSGLRGVDELQLNETVRQTNRERPVAVTPREEIYRPRSLLHAPGIATVQNVDPPVTHTYTSVKPGTMIIVTLVQDGGLDAQMICGTLGPKYGVKSDNLKEPSK